MSTVTEETRKKANLRLLQRTCDSSITDILASATHVVLYEFAQAAWSKSDVEGSLFVVTTVKAGTTAYLLVILNRSSSDNFTMDILSNLQTQHQDPYLIVKRTITNTNGGAASTSIQGIWFQHAHERVSLLQTVEQLIESLQFLAMQQQQQQQQQQTQKMPPSQRTPPLAANSTPLRVLPGQQQQQQPAPTPPSQMTPISQLLAAAHQPQQQQAQAQLPFQSPVVPQPSPAPDHAVTPDERLQLAHLLSQTAISATTASSQSTPNQSNTTTTTTSTTPAAASSPAAGVALDKRALQLALLSLIQDDRFLDLLHSQYLRVMKARNAPGSNAK